MNLEELQIKIGIELKELNKQLKKASDDINEHIGPKATKKMMSENNKAIKRGLDEIRRTTKYSIKQMRKDTTEEIDDMSKDIHKSLTKAFDIDLTKFNKNIDSSMAQAKRSVRSACNDIRKELNAALNVKANIRVSASTSAQRQSSNSKSDAYAILASSQYTAAMMVKAINAMIDTNNKNTTRLEGAINKSTDKIVSAINKANSANPNVKNHTSASTSSPTKRVAVRKPQHAAETTTRGQLVGQPYGPDNRALIDALKNAYKTINILNRNLSALNNLKNIKQLGTGSYGSNNPQGGTVNWRQGRKGQTTPLFKGEIVNPITVSIPVEPFKQIQDIIEVINYEIKDFETGLVKVGSRAVSVAKTLNKARTGSQPLEGEIIDSGKLAKNKGITQKGVIIPAEFKVIDDELQEQINDAVKKIKIPKLLNTKNFELGKEGILDTSQISALKQVHELKQKINNTPLRLDEPTEDYKKSAFAANELHRQIVSLIQMSEELNSRFRQTPVNLERAAEDAKFLEEAFEAVLKGAKQLNSVVPDIARSFDFGRDVLDDMAPGVRSLVKEIQKAASRPQRPDGFAPKQGVPGQVTKPQRPDWYNPTPGVPGQVTKPQRPDWFKGANIVDVEPIDIKVNDDATKKLKSIKEQILEIQQEFDFVAMEELPNFAIDENLFKEQFGSIEEYASDLYDLYENLQKLDDERIKLDIDTEDAKKQIKDLQEIIVTYIDSISNGEFKDNIKAATGTSEKAQGTKQPNKGKKPPKPTIMGFGFGGFKNEIDTIIEYAKKAGSKIKKALSDSTDELAMTIDDENSYGFMRKKKKKPSKSNPFSNGINIENSTVNGETKTTVNGKDLKDLTSEELDAYNKAMSESNKAYTDAMKNLNNAMNGMAGSFSNNLESSLNNLGDSISESVKRSIDAMNDPNLLKILKDKGIKPGDSFDETFTDQYGNKTRVKSTYTDNSINNNNLNNGYNGKDIKDLASEKLEDLNSAMAEMEKEFGNFNDAMDNFNKSIEEMTESILNNVDDVKAKDLKNANDAHSQTKNSVKNSFRDTEVVDGKVVSDKENIPENLNDYIRDVIESVNEEIESAINDLEDINFKEFSEGINETFESFVDEFGNINNVHNRRIDSVGNKVIVNGKEYDPEEGIKPGDNSTKANSALKKHQESIEKMQDSLNEITTGLKMMEDEPDTDKLDTYLKSLQKIGQLTEEVQTPLTEPNSGKRNNNSIFDKAKDELDKIKEYSKKITKDIKNSFANAFKGIGKKEKSKKEKSPKEPRTKLDTSYIPDEDMADYSGLSKRQVKFFKDWREEIKKAEKSCISFNNKLRTMFPKINFDWGNKFDKFIIQQEEEARLFFLEVEKELTAFEAKVKNKIKRLVSLIKKSFASIKFSKLYNNIANALSKAKTSVSKFAKNVKPILNKVFTNIKTGKFYNDTIKAFNKAKAAIFKFANNARTTLNRVFTNIKTGRLYNDVSKAFNKAKVTVSNFASAARTKLNKVFDGIKSTKLYASIASALNKAKSAVSKFAGKVRPILNKAFSKVNFSNIGGAISKGLNGAKKALTKFANGCKTIWGKIKQIFSKGANDASKATGKLTTGLKGLLARALGFFSLYGLINLGKQAITQSQTLAQAEVKLTSLMKQRMGATNETVRAIRNLAKEQANLGVVSETAMVRGAEQLSMYVHSAKALEKLMPAIANMTARRGGFNATPEDAEEIATQLGEAIREGTTTPLEQSGIYLSEAEIKKFQALRTEEERANFLAAQIAKNVGNINEALANTPHGAIAQLKNNFQSLLGTLGTLLVNVIQPIVKWLNVVVVAANNALKALGELLGFDMSGGGLAGVDLGTGSTGTGTDTSGIDGATDSLEDAKDAAGEAEEAVEKFKGSLMGFDEINILSNNLNDKDKEEDDPTNITPGEGGQLDPGEYVPSEMTEGENIFTKFGEKMKAFMDEVLEPFKAAWDELGDRWKTAWADLVESFRNACDSLASFLKSVWDNGGKEFVQHMAEIGLACGIAAMEIGGTILDALAKLWDHLDPEKNMHTQRLLDVLNEVSVKLRDFILGLNEHLENLLEYGGQDVLNAMGDCFMDLAAAAVNSFGVIIDAVDGLIDHLDPKFNQDTRNMLQATADMFHATGQAAWDFSELLRSSLENGGQDLINALGTCFVNLGETIARVITTSMESLSEFFDYIDPAKNDITREMMKSWEEAFYAIGDAALEFADLFESVMNNGGQEVLNKLGDAFNSLVGLVGDCVKEIADALDGLFEHLDPKTNQFTQDMLSAWERAFEDIADMCDSLSDLIGSAMDNGGQEIVNSVGDLGMKLGEAFGVVVEECAETFSGLFDHMNPENNEHSKKMMDALDGLVDSITEFVDACVEAFQKFMDNGGREIVNNLGDILAIVIDLAAELGSGIIDIITGFMNSWVGQTLIEGVAQALEWVTDKLVGLSDAFDVVKDIFQNIVDIIVGVFEGDGEKVGKAFANLIKNAFKLTGELIQWLWDIGCDIVEGLVKGICALPELLWDAVQFIFDTIVSFFKELFGIHSPSTVFAELGEFLIEGLAQGVTDCVNAVTDAFKKIGDAIFGAIKEIKDTVSEKFKEIKDTIKDKLKETKEVVSEKWGEIKTTVSEKAKETYEAVKENWKNIKDTVSERTKETYNTVKEKFGDIYNTVKDKAGDTYEKVSENWTKMKEDAGKKLEQIRTDAEKKYDQVKSSLVKKIGEVKTETVSKWNEVKTETIEGIEKVREKAEEKYELIKETMTRKLEQIKSTTSSKWEEIKKDTADKVESLRTTAEEKYDSLKEKLLTKLENTKASMGSKWDTIKSEAVKKCGEMATEAHNKFSDIKNKFTKKMDEVKSALGPKWDSLKSQASTSASDIVSKFQSGIGKLGSNLSSTFSDLKTTIKNKLTDIGGLFKNLNWEVKPKIKLPKVSVTWKDVGGEGGVKIPSFSVNWNKRGGIIDGITPLGFAGGALQMGGEAGKELVMPLENTSFTTKIAKAMGQAVDNALARNFNNSSNGDSPYVNDSRDVVLQVDGREFARASINSINKLQRESGRTLLDI